MNSTDTAAVVQSIRAGKVGVMPTDTVYGLVASALNSSAVEEVYRIKNRPSTKPCVVLIADVSQLDSLAVELEYELREALENVWPGPNSVILPSSGPHYLHRDTWSLAVRLPALEWLNSIVELTGPIIATSANPSGVAAVQDLGWIREQLPNLDFYYEGHVRTQPSTLYRYDNGILVEAPRQ